MQNNYQYNYIIKNNLINKFHYTNPMQVPKIHKITIKTALNETTQIQKKILPYNLALENITGQKALNIKAKTSVANFKLKKGQITSCKITLRKTKLKIFLIKFITHVLPQIKDFTGLQKKKKTDSITLGIKNIQIFFEIQQQINKYKKLFGLDITIHINTQCNKQSNILLKAYQIPIIK